MAKGTKLARDGQGTPPVTRTLRAPQRQAAASAPKTRTAQIDRRRELVEIAGRLFAERGFLATTIRDVAEAAGIQSGSLYHHFSSKESMADELLREYWSTLLSRYEAVASTGASATDEARQMIRESVLLLESCEYAVRMSTNDWSYLASIFPFLGESLDQCEQIWIATLERGIASGEFTSDVAPNLFYRTIMAAIGGTARWYRPGGRLRIDELADDMARIFLRGLTVRTA